jgi:hypothetical protein
MRAHFITSGSRSNLVRRPLIVCLAVAVFTSGYLAVTRAEADPSLTIQYFGATSIGNSMWLADCVVEAEDMSSVSIEYTGAATASLTPNAQGHVGFIFSADPGDILYVEVTDSTETASDEAELIDNEI